jgi:AhpD family alkylhydroperoxidase
MSKRFEWFKVAPDLGHALLELQELVNSGGIEPALLELVKMRASQLNGCAFCLDMHSKDARAAGESEQRLYLLNAWREAAHLYSARERAALAWTEAVTTVRDGHVPDAHYEEARAQFSELELVYLTVAITQINTWNRLNVAFRVEAGGYRPGMFKRTKAA